MYLKFFPVFIVLRKVVSDNLRISACFSKVLRKYQFLTWKVLQDNLPNFLRVIQVFFWYSCMNFGAN